MNTHNNKKGLFYKDKLKSALLRLLHQNVGIEQITVTALCEEAKVNRSTFYSHYSIPHDILNEIEEEVLHQAYAYLREISDVDYNSLTYLLKYIKEHDDVFRVLFLQSRDTLFQEKILQQAIRNFRQLKSRYINRKDYEYVNAFIMSGSREILNHWIATDYERDADDIAALILKLNKNAIQAFIT